MTSKNINHHIYYWLEKVEKNIAEYKKIADTLTNAEKAEFIVFQYHLVMLINKALTGDTIFIGANPIEFPSEDLIEENIDNIIGV